MDCLQCTYYHLQGATESHPQLACLAHPRRPWLPTGTHSAILWHSVMRPSCEPRYALCPSVRLSVCPVPTSNSERRHRRTKIDRNVPQTGVSRVPIISSSKGRDHRTFKNSKNGPISSLHANTQALPTIIIRQVNVVNGGDNVFTRILSVCLSVRSGVTSLMTSDCVLSVTSPTSTMVNIGSYSY